MYEELPAFFVFPYFLKSEKPFMSVVQNFKTSFCRNCTKKPGFFHTGQFYKHLVHKLSTWLTTENMPKNKLYTELSTLSTKNGVESMCLNLAKSERVFWS